LSKSLVLVVDDESANRALLEEILRREGHEVVTANDGRRALEQFKLARPDLVLLDVQMPYLNGYEVCRTLKADSETRLTPVVLITSLAATEDRVRGLEAGADDFLTKPVERASLLARTRSLLSLKRFTDELEHAETVLFTLARSIEGKDAYTGGHCERLSDHSARLAEAIGLSAEQVKALRRAGIVHDIGKVAIPDSILGKPGRLTEQEFAVVKEHPVVGERICAPLRSFHLVLPIIRHHHEKMNGTGYPDGLRGDDIPVTARILQIVDVYDALTTARPYKAALSASETLQIMEDEVNKGWWDPDIFREFSRLELPQTRSAAV
jgi:putative two-component system response regulator